MVIREMNYSDIDRVRMIAADTWRDTYTSFIPAEIQDKVLKEAYSNEEMDNRLKSSINLVAESNGVMMGYAFFSGARGIFRIHLSSSKLPREGGWEMPIGNRSF